MRITRIFHHGEQKKIDQDILQNEILQKSTELKDVFDKQERLAVLKQEYSQLITELQYFNQYLAETDVEIDNIK